VEFLKLIQCRVGPS